jgi:hypothetical protein
VAGQPSQQLRLARVRRRIDSRNGETIRYSRERQPAYADHRIYGTDSESNANSYSDPHRYSHGHGDGHFDTDSNADANTNPMYWEVFTDAKASSHASAAPGAGLSGIGD